MDQKHIFMLDISENLNKVTRGLEVASANIF